MLIIDVAGGVNYPPADDTGHLDTSIVKRIHLTTVRTEDASPTFLAQSQGYDTAVLEQVCDVGTEVPRTFRNALPAWIAAGTSSSPATRIDAGTAARRNDRLALERR